jgi:glycosyltransferase involved in cell wall biosynthesis
MVTTIQQGWPLTTPVISRPRRIIEFLIELAVCKKYRRIILLNRHHELQLLRWGISREKIRLIPNGIDCNGFLEMRKKPKTLRQKLGVPQGAMLVLSLGRLAKGKGIENLLEAWQMVQERAPKPVWAVVMGDGPLRRSLMKRAHNIPHIVFTGSVSHAEVLSAYAESDLFVMPSQGGEGMPTVLLEAMAAGLPVIATRIPGHTEIVDTTFGRLVPPGDAQQLALALLDLVDDPNSLRQMGNHALLLSKRYDWSVITARVTKVYESCQQM